MSLLPREHGAYGQITFPLLTALAVAGVSTAGLLFIACVVAAFVAHEPATVLLGFRGPRARRELHQRARWWLGSCLAVCAVTGLGALVAIAPPARWSFAVPALPALLLVSTTVRGREKSWLGEAAAAVAFSGAAVPVAMAAGASLTTAALVAIPFALFFVASTLAVRAVILRVRGGGDPRASSATRRAALSLCVVAAAALAVLGMTGALPLSILVAAAPGLLTAAVIAASPPSPTRLRTVGWTLVAMSVVTAAVVIAAAQD